jgi:hypothetical protein
LTASGTLQKVEKIRENSANGKRERGKKDQGSLQVGVLIAMPSQLHMTNYDDTSQDLSGSALRDGLAIGLVEMPWVIDVDS